MTEATGKRVSAKRRITDVEWRTANVKQAGGSAICRRVRRCSENEGLDPTSLPDLPMAVTSRNRSGLYVGSCGPAKPTGKPRLGRSLALPRRHYSRTRYVSVHDLVQQREAEKFRTTAPKSFGYLFSVGFTAQRARETYPRVKPRV